MATVRCYSMHASRFVPVQPGRGVRSLPARASKRTSLWFQPLHSCFRKWATSAPFNSNHHNHSSYFELIDHQDQLFHAALTGSGCFGVVWTRNLCHTDLCWRWLYSLFYQGLSESAQAFLELDAQLDLEPVKLLEEAKSCWRWMWFPRIELFFSELHICRLSAYPCTIADFLIGWHS